MEQPRYSLNLNCSQSHKLKNKHRTSTQPLIGLTHITVDPWKVCKRIRHLTTNTNITLPPIQTITNLQSVFILMSNSHGSTFTHEVNERSYDPSQVLIHFAVLHLLFWSFHSGGWPVLHNISFFCEYWNGWMKWNNALVHIHAIGTLKISIQAKYA